MAPEGNAKMLQANSLLEIHAYLSCLSHGLALACIAVPLSVCCKPHSLTFVSLSPLMNYWSFITSHPFSKDGIDPLFLD